MDQANSQSWNIIHRLLTDGVRVDEKGKRVDAVRAAVAQAASALEPLAQGLEADMDAIQAARAAVRSSIKSYVMSERLLSAAYCADFALNAVAFPCEAEKVLQSACDTADRARRPAALLGNTISKSGG